jgi:hypothetical protein
LLQDDSSSSSFHRYGTDSEPEASATGLFNGLFFMKTGPPANARGSDGVRHKAPNRERQQEVSREKQDKRFFKKIHLF